MSNHQSYLQRKAAEQFAWLDKAKRPALTMNEYKHGKPST